MRSSFRIYFLAVGRVREARKARKAWNPRDTFIYVMTFYAYRNILQKDESSVLK